MLTWWRSATPTAHGDSVVFPLIFRYGGKSPTTVVAPLWWDFKRGSSRTTVVLRRSAPTGTAPR